MRDARGDAQSKMRCDSAFSSARQAEGKGTLPAAAMTARDAAHAGSVSKGGRGEVTDESDGHPDGELPLETLEATPATANESARVTSDDVL